MHHLGISSFGLQMVLEGQKTIELCLGTPAFLKLRVGDTISLREINQSAPDAQNSPGKALVEITQLLYFENLEEALDSINFAAVIPAAKNPGEVLSIYKQLYNKQNEEEHGVIAITFKLAR